MLLSNFSSELLWWQRGVTYQIYPRSFIDTNGDGVGDLQGILDRLDYLNDGTPGSLGVDAIWLSPFYPSPMKDFGYDVSDYKDVHPLFGDLAVFQRLLQAAHGRNLKVIIDYVPNHTSDQHPWFLESRSSRDNPKRDWYIWHDPKPDGSPPNNWGSHFGGPAWEWDPPTGQYYFHHFLKEQPDLNWRNPLVKEAMLDVLRFWLDLGVDGFRMDVVGLLLKDPDFRDNPLDPNPSPDLAENDFHHRQLNLYNQDLDEVHEIIREFRDLLEEYGDRMAIGEVWQELPRWIRYYGSQGEGLHLPFNFRLIRTVWKARAVRQSVDELEAALPAFAWPNYVLGNHDVARLASRVGQGQARVAAMLLLTLRGTPTIYYGDELGLEDGLITPDKLQDPQGVRMGSRFTRDIARTPMQWENSPQAGFSSAEPWLPLSPDWEMRNVAVMSADPTSILNLYRRLLVLRKNTRALQGGSYHPVEGVDPDLFVYLREHPTGRFLVALNFASQPRRLEVPGDNTGWIALSTHLDREGKTSLDGFILRPDEGVVMALKAGDQ